MARNVSHESESPIRNRGSPRRRERSPVRNKDRHSSRAKSPKRKSPRASVSRSPSPRTKRLKRAQAEKESERPKEREHEKHNGRGSEKSSHRERERERDKDKEKLRDKGRDRDRERERERNSGREERRSGRDEMDERASRARRERSVSPSDGNHRSRHRSHSPRHDKESNSRAPEEHNDDDDSVARMKAAEEALEAKQKEKPSFELSGKLAAETNRFRGITLLFNEPPDARKPNIRWRLYVFKAGEVLNEPLYIHRQSCYLFGRERRVADIPTDHPSCSKQHAVIQYRQMETEHRDGTMSKDVRPYIMDLGSTNKTFLNENPIEPQRYYELFEKDTIRFGNSSREYVLLHENSA